MSEYPDWAVYQKPAIAFGVYGALERLLIPLGLHHIWNAPFYLEVGQYQLLGHEVVRGEVARYLAGDPQAKPCRWLPDQNVGITCGGTGYVALRRSL